MEVLGTKGVCFLSGVGFLAIMVIWLPRYAKELFEIFDIHTCPSSWRKLEGGGTTSLSTHSPDA
jgi:hypothetical protein